MTDKEYQQKLIGNCHTAADCFVTINDEKMVTKWLIWGEQIQRGCITSQDLKRWLHKQAELYKETDKGLATYIRNLITVKCC
jgi:hypothetical protein